MDYDYETLVQQSVSDKVVGLAMLTTIEIKNNDQAIELNSVIRTLKKRMKRNEKEQYLKVVYVYLRSLVKAYEATLDFNGASGVDVLQYLMDAHGHKQKDLLDIFSRSNISEILAGKRDLNLRHIKALAIKYHTNPSVFID